MPSLEIDLFLAGKADSNSNVFTEEALMDLAERNEDLEYDPERKILFIRIFQDEFAIFHKIDSLSEEK